MRRILFVFSIALLTMAAACQQGPAGTPTPTPGASKPNVVIVSPASNTTVQSGTSVQVQSTSADADGVVLVELAVDGQTLQNSPTPNGQPQPQFSVIQNWTATTPGTHTITVKATNAHLGSGEASITINVAQKIAEATQTLVVTTGTPEPSTATPNATPGGIATSSGVPTPSGQPTPSGPATCTLASTFINDVTIPDGTVVAPGGSFVKTWAIQNSGTCVWGGGYNAVLVGGQPFGASSPQPIPAAGPGDIINISVNMFAPTAPGPAASIWQLQASNGVVFGTKFDANVVVPGAPTPKPPPTAIPPTPIPPTGCNGTPVMSSFTANPQSITAGQLTTLSWGAVQNANAVYLTSPSGTQGVGTPGTLQVQPSQTTTYTLTAYCNNIPNQIQVTVTVNGSAGACTGNNTPIFNGFYATPQTINAGDETTLVWGLVQNASSVYLQFPNHSEGVATPGTRTVKPVVTTTYTLVAYCGNNKASISITVNVNGGCSGNPNFNGFTASPTTITKGQTTVLSWGIVTNATSVYLKTPQGTGGVSTPNSITVKPDVTTTYTLIAYCYNTQVTKSVTVTVNSPTTPTPTPTPIPNKIVNIQVQRRDNNSTIRMRVTYFWNGQNSPAHIQGVGLRNGKPNTNTASAPVVAGSNQLVVLDVTGGLKIDQVNVCLIGQNGTELVCGQKPVP